jgi:hypothetical protein
MDGNKKKFIPPLGIDNEFFHSVFFNPWTKAQSEWCAPYCAFGQWPIIVLDGAESLRGFHSMGDERIFLKNRCASSFNKDLSNEPNFGRIHLAGQYL